MEPITNFDKVRQVIEANGSDKTKLIPILQAVQNEYRYLPEEVIAYIASSLGISAAHVFGVATFFSHFSLVPKGKHIIKVCDGTACHVKSSKTIIAALKKRLGLSGEEITTPDMLFTLEAVSCIGACGLAPVVLVGEDVYGMTSPDKMVKVIDDIAQKEGAK